MAGIVAFVWVVGVLALLAGLFWIATTSPSERREASTIMAKAVFLFVGICVGLALYSRVENALATQLGTRLVGAGYVLLTACWVVGILYIAGLVIRIAPASKTSEALRRYKGLLRGLRAICWVAFALWLGRAVWLGVGEMPVLSRIGELRSHEVYALRGAAALLAMLAPLVGGFAGRWERLPGIFTTVGIVGTFAGVFMALWPFIVGGAGTQVQDKMPDLLSGVGFAMVTSIVGVGLALIGRLLLAALYRPEAPEDKLAKALGRVLGEQTRQIEAQTQQIIHQLRVQAEHSHASDQDQTEVLRSVAAGIHAGNTQQAETQKAWVTTVERQAAQQQQLGQRMEAMAGRVEEAVTGLAQSSADSIAAAMMKVVDTFDQQIQQQLGESFRELRGAADRLTEWQEKHITEIAFLHDALVELRPVSQAISDATAAHQQQLEMSEALLARVEAGVQSASQAVDSLRERLPGFEEEALDVVGEIGNRMLEIGLSMSTYLDQYKRRMEEAVAEQTNAMQRAVGDSTSVLEGAIRKQAQDITDATTESVVRLSQTMGTVAESLADGGQRVERRSAELAGAFKEALADLTQLREKQHELLRDYLDQYGDKLRELAGSQLSEAAREVTKSMQEHARLQGQWRSQVQNGQERLLASFEKLHHLVGLLGKGADKYGDTATALQQTLLSVSNSTAQMREEARLETQIAVQEIANALAQIHDHYRQQLDALQAETSALSATAGGGGLLKSLGKSNHAN